MTYCDIRSLVSMDNTFSNKRIAKNTAFLYVRMAFVMFVTLYTVRVVLSVLGEIDYGIYNVVCGLVYMFGVLNTTLSSAISRFYNFAIGQRSEKGVTKVYSTSIILQILLAVIVVVVAETVGVWYMNNKMVIPDDRMIVARWIFQFAVFSLVLLVLQTPYVAAVTSFERMDYLAIVGIIDASMKLIIVYILKIVSFDKLLLYGVLMLGISVVNFLLYFIYCKIKFKEIYWEKGVGKELMKPMLSFSGWLLLDPVAYAIKGQGSNMALNFFHGPVMNTAFGVSNQVSAALDSFGGNISTAFRPQIIQSYSEGNHLRTKKLMYSMSKIVFVLKLLICVPIVLEADYLLHLWLGNFFPEIAISFSQMMVIIGVINGFAHPITVVIYAKGNMKRYMTLTSIVVSSVLPISILLLMFGTEPICVYWTMLASAVLNLVVSILILSQEFKEVSVGDYFISVLRPCFLHAILSVLLPLFVWILMPSSFLRLLFVGVAACLAALVSAYFFVLNEVEKDMLRGFFVNATHRFKMKK